MCKGGNNTSKQFPYIKLSLSPSFPCLPPLFYFPSPLLPHTLVLSLSCQSPLFKLAGSGHHQHGQPPSGIASEPTATTSPCPTTRKRHGLPPLRCSFFLSSFGRVKPPTGRPILTANDHCPHHHIVRRPSAASPTPQHLLSSSSSSPVAAWPRLAGASFHQPSTYRLSPAAAADVPPVPPPPPQPPSCLIDLIV